MRMGGEPSGDQSGTAAEQAAAAPKPNIMSLDPDALVELLRARLAEHQARTADPTGLRCAAVLVPLLFRDGEAYLLFTQRSEGLRTHKGQISFPGGSLDRCDADLAAAALRETHEEIGIPPERVRLLGRLDDHATNTTGFVITPFVGVVPAGAAHLTSDLEVARMIEVPLAALLDPATLQPDHRTRHGQYVGRDTVIWGATARILTSFLGILASPSSS